MLKKKINGFYVLVCWFFYIAFGVYLFNFSYYRKVKEYSQNAEIPEEIFGSSSVYFYGFLNNIGEVGRSIYHNFQLLDYINFLLFGFTLFITVYYFLAKIQTHKLSKIALLFPVIFVVLDALENSLILYLLSVYPIHLDSLANLIGVLTILKLVFATFSIIFCLIGTIVFVFRFIYRK